MTARIYCSVESRQKNEPLPGMGKHSASNLLIQWPISCWSDNLRRARDMTAEELAWVDQIAESGRRINLIDRPGESGDTHLIYQFPEALAYRVARSELPDFLAALNASQPLDPWQVGRTPERVLLCCTHGKKDKCCARFGNQAWRALTQAQQAHNLPVDIWRCTHLGGCRFAASAIMFPERRKYGRIEPEEALPLLQAEVSRQPRVPNFRGSPDLTPAQQCAEVSALGWLQARGYTAELEVQPVTVEATDTRVPIDWRDTASGASGRLAVTCRPNTLWRYTTCKDIPEGQTEATYWAVDSIQEL